MIARGYRNCNVFFRIYNQEYKNIVVNTEMMLPEKTLIKIENYNYVEKNIFELTLKFINHILVTFMLIMYIYIHILHHDQLEDEGCM